MQFKDKTALITGAAQGIGKALAQAFAKEGANIAVSDVNLELATQTANEIKGSGVKTIPLKMNVADPTEVEAGVKRAIEELGKIDILVNNAGITKDNLFLRMKKEDWDAVISVNLTGVFNLCKMVSRLMMKERYGRIINIASVAGEMGNVGQANYSASKAGVVGLTNPNGYDRQDPGGDKKENTGSDTVRETWAAGRCGGGGPLLGQQRRGLHYRPGHPGQRRDLYVNSKRKILKFCALSIKF